MYHVPRTYVPGTFVTVIVAKAFGHQSSVIMLLFTVTKLKDPHCGTQEMTAHCSLNIMKLVSSLQNVIDAW
jgi:hypothetical protein